MTDIRTVQIIEPFAITIDWLLRTDGTLDETQELATAVIVALGTDRLAKDTDILPDLDETDRRGWWGDVDAEELFDGWPIGTRLWLLKRQKIVGPEAAEGGTVERAETYTRESLQPFIARRVASRMAVHGERIGRERINVTATLYRGPTNAIELRYQSLWQGII